MELFKKPDVQYRSNIEPTKNYMSQAVTFLNKFNNKSKEENVKIVKDALDHYKLKKPKIVFRYRKDNGDTEERSIPLTSYLKEVSENNEVIVPSFTTYLNPEVKTSLHSRFITKNVNLRKSDKAKMFKYKQENDLAKSGYYNKLQKIRKIYVNSLSGSYGSEFTVLYNASAHYSLTSMTRSVTSIGNAVTESMVEGNLYLKSPSIAISYITSIVDKLNINLVKNTMDGFKLKYPTVDDVSEAILENCHKYWQDIDKESIIKEYISKLSDVERAAVLYTNNLNQVRIHNDDFVRTMLKNISKKQHIGSVDYLTDIESVPPYVMILVHYLCKEDIKGLDVSDYSKLVGTDILATLASTAKSIYKELLRYSMLFNTFFITDIMPPTIAYIKDMLRECIVLSDTDSTCGAYDSWVIWYFKELKFTDEAIAIATTVMTISSQVTTHYIQMLGSNMNMAKDKRELLKMKNEFYWSTFVSSNVNKHYYASAIVQEGKVFKEPDLEIKGVHLIASAVSKDIRELATSMMKDIQREIVSDSKVMLTKYIKKVADTERYVINAIKNGDTSIFKIDKIKNPGSYKLGPERSPYFHHMLWTEVFKDKYGYPGEPTYMVINIKVTADSKRLFLEYLEKIEDTTIRNRLLNFITKYNKLGSGLGSFKIPLSIAKEKGVPKEIYPIIDFYKVVTVNCNVLYLILESIGFYRKNKLLISEMGY